MFTMGLCDSDGFFKKSATDPWWYSEDEKPCMCSKKEHKPKVIKSYTGYSDFLYMMIECPQCKKQWCDWLEG